MEIKFKINQTLKMFKIKIFFYIRGRTFNHQITEKMVKMTLRALAEINLIESLSFTRIVVLVYVNLE